MADEHVGTSNIRLREILDKDRRKIGNTITRPDGRDDVDIYRATYGSLDGVSLENPVEAKLITYRECRIVENGPEMLGYDLYDEVGKLEMTFKVKHSTPAEHYYFKVCFDDSGSVCETTGPIKRTQDGNVTECVANELVVIKIV